MMRPILPGERNSTRASTWTLRVESFSGAASYRADACCLVRLRVGESALEAFAWVVTDHLGQGDTRWAQLSRVEQWDRSSE